MNQIRDAEKRSATATTHFGVGPPGTVEAQVDEKWRRVVAPNLNAYFDGRQISPDVYQNLKSAVYALSSNYNITKSTVSRDPPTSTPWFRANTLMYNELKSFFWQRLKHLNQKLRSVAQDDFLAAYAHIFDDYCSRVKVLIGVMNPLDSLTQFKSMGPGVVYDVSNLALVSWRDSLLKVNSRELLLAILKGICIFRESYEKEPEGVEIVDLLHKDYIKNLRLAVSSLKEVGIVPGEKAGQFDTSLGEYKKYFEQTYFPTLRNYLVEASKKCKLQDMDAAQKVVQIGNWFYLESLMLDTCMDSSSIPCVKQIFQEVFMASNDAFLTDAIPALCQSWNFNCLKYAYDIADNLGDGATAIFKKAYAQAIEKIGRDMFRAFEDELKDPRNRTKEKGAGFGKQLVDYQANLRVCLQTSFSGDMDFLDTTDEVMQKLLSTPIKVGQGIRDKTAAEQLVLYMDNVLRKKRPSEGNEGGPEAYENAVQLLRNMFKSQAGDDFALYYKYYLANRLLHKQSASDDEEKEFIVKMKTTLGAIFTSSMERILRDVEYSKATTENFKTYCQTQNSPIPFEFEMTLCTLGQWQLEYDKYTLHLDSQVAQVLFQAREFFLLKCTTNRKLDWVHNKSTAVLQASKNCFKNGKQYRFDLNACQANCLLHFNQTVEWTVQDLMVAINLKDERLFGAIIESFWKKGILLVDGNGPQGKNPFPKIQESTKITLNLDWSDNFIAQKVPFRFIAERNGKVKVDEEVEQRKRNALDALLVRLMKAANTLTQTELIVQVLEQKGTNSGVSVKMIEEEIAKLIEAEYFAPDAAFETNKRLVYKA